MKRIVFLGNSIACSVAMEEIRNADPGSELLFFPLEGGLPYKRELAAKYIAKEISFKELLFKPQDFYKRSNVQVHTKELNRINFRKNQISTEEKEAIPFDVLVIAGAQDFKFPDIKGVNKIGVYAWKKLDDINKIFNEVPLIDTVVIQGDGPDGLELAQAFQKRGKEAILITKASQDLPQAFAENPAEGEAIKPIQTIVDHTITEILGDSEAKAIRLSSGKVLATQLIIFTDVNLNLKFLSETPLTINKSIVVDAQYRTNLKNVFACDWACEAAEAQDLIQQGKIVAGQILNESNIGLQVSALSGSTSLTILSQSKDSQQLKADA
ncbi:MAG: hypothetical protein A2Z88_09320 [Omnitrophica WOR_2 bacterium GWA2_47_8]|nr:MAG: hypothetical protein A2Z88_09320 [Omnitrophica WOR_2 bacterium GWA2_47_8]